MKLPRSYRITLAVAALLLAVMYVAPLWSISLEAPQYPEGLGLEILLTDVQGQKPHDLTNINNLNHYIGMKRIEPDAIPELRYMPWIVAFLIGFGLLAAASGRTWMLYTWCGLFLVIAVAGVFDFWLWAYDYGHNLDTETAAITVPGMSYQPPIIGSKKLLNFTAHSWPALGGWAAFVSLAMGFLLAFGAWRQRGAERAASALVSATAVFGLLVLFAGCVPERTPIVFGEDRDDFCRMVISDVRFASQLVTTSGRTYNFDSIECLRGFIESGTVPEGEVHELWLTDFPTGEIMPAAEAFVLMSASVSSPMGGGMAAFLSKEEAEAFVGVQDEGFSVLSWKDMDSSLVSVSHRHGR